jgi:hypothetical protein
MFFNVLCPWFITNATNKVFLVVFGCYLLIFNTCRMMTVTYNQCQIVLQQDYCQVSDHHEHLSGRQAHQVSLHLVVEIMIVLITAVININIAVISGRFNQFHVILLIAIIISNYFIQLQEICIFVL